MTKKDVFLIFLFFLFGMSAFAQDDMLTVTRTRVESAPQLHGAGGVIFIAETADFVIKTSDDRNECSKPRKSGNHYEYEMRINVPDSKPYVFIVAKIGVPLTGRSNQTYIRSNEYTYFNVGQPEIILGKTEETVDSKAYFAKGKNPKEALIEINSGIKLDIGYSDAINMIHRSAIRNGTYIDSLIFEVPRLAQLKSVADSLEAAYVKLENASNSGWTDEQWRALEELKEKMKEAGEVSNSAAVITLQGKGTNQLRINEALVRGLTPKDKLVYGIMLVGRTDTIIKERSFSDLYAISRDYCKNYPTHATFSYFEAAQLALKAAFEHNDCPAATRESIRTERDSMLSIRKQIYKIETVVARAAKHESERGFEDVKVYNNLNAGYLYADTLYKYHPEMTAIKDLKEGILLRLQSHPCGQKQVGVDTIMHKRETLSGLVKFKREEFKIPFNQMHVFATSTEKIKNSSSRIIGKVRGDGRYEVVKPDDIKPLYIYVTGEKSRAHYVPEGMNTLDIIIKY